MQNIAFLALFSGLCTTVLPTVGVQLEVLQEIMVIKGVYRILYGHYLQIMWGHNVQRNYRV